MTDEQAQQAGYHLDRRNAERRKAACAATEEARDAHVELARLHDIKLLMAHLPPQPR